MEKLIISFTGAICVFIILITYYKIIKKDSLTSRGDQARGVIQNEDDPDNSTSTQLESAGLASAVIHSLPAIQFRGQTAGGDDHGTIDNDCAVCLGEFSEGEWLRLLPNCAHIFHVTCVDAWFRFHSSCPLCRTNVLYDFSSSQSQVSMVTPLEIIQGEGINHERLLGYRMRNLELRWGEVSSDRFIADSDCQRTPSIGSPLVLVEPDQTVTETPSITVQIVKEESSSRDMESSDCNAQGYTALSEVPE